MEEPEPFPSNRARNIAAFALLQLVFTLFVIINGANSESMNASLAALTVNCLVQLVLGIAAIVISVDRSRRETGGLAGGIVAIVAAVLGWGVGVALMVLTAVGHVAHDAVDGALKLGGGSPGRPLRVRGNRVHPSLTPGSDWASGARPDPAGLDEDTRRALEALWLRDAQLEHASVPAFSRLSWLLASAGAPAELIEWSHRAAIEEISHARACFALAAGYGGRAFTVEPMPELSAGLDGAGDPRVTLAVESLADGCQLEDFNADLAAACAASCEEPVTRAVLDKIAREERSHAELAWAVLTWTISRHRDVVLAPLATATRALVAQRRPTAVATDHQALVARASERALRAYGRLPDARWQVLWNERLVATRARLELMLAQDAA